jgi:hypothetical protein
MTQLTLFEVEQPPVEMLTFYHAKHKMNGWHIVTPDRDDLHRHEGNSDWEIWVETYPRPEWHKGK